MCRHQARRFTRFLDLIEYSQDGSVIEFDGRRIAEVSAECLRKRYLVFNVPRLPSIPAHAGPLAGRLPIAHTVGDDEPTVPEPQQMGWVSKNLCLVQRCPGAPAVSTL